MKSPDFDKERLRKLVSDALDGQLDEVARQELNQVLASGPEARSYYRELMNLHARLHLEYSGGSEADFMPGQPSGRLAKPHIRWQALGLAAAAVIALLVAFFMRGSAPESTFARLEKSHSARWASSDLPTSEGSRLGSGTLRLEEGLAVIRFDSGAEVSLEAPVDLHLVDAMNCRVMDGTAVANVPVSATGFRITTPSATVIDYGTRFAVNVDPQSGGTRTQVFEGLVEVENPTTGEKISLRTGQRASVQGRQTGPVTEGFDERFHLRTSESQSNGPGWMLLESYKDAYTGYHLDTDSTELLYVKHGISGFHRKAYLGFDLSAVDPERVESARLLLQFEPTGLGLASHVPDSTFAVYGLAENDQPWDENHLQRHNAPANIMDTGAGLTPDAVRKLGTFTVPQGVQRGPFGIDGGRLTDYLREHAGSTITLIVLRETVETGSTGLVHGIASRRHPVLPAPTISIRIRED